MSSSDTWLRSGLVINLAKDRKSALRLRPADPRNGSLASTVADRMRLDPAG
jgi:hypothetical protein